MRKVTVAATQMACGNDERDNILHAEKLIRKAAQKGGQIILLQELFELPYFCQEANPEYFKLASTLEGCKAVKYFSKLARELNIVLPVSFFEKENNARFNSDAVIDADGSVLGVYRKIHIPDSAVYREKYYFNSGNLGFKVWNTKYAKLGVGICWDQWFPETARCLALKGAEIVMYPTAIGSEPADPHVDSRQHWQRVMQGHAAANIVPVVASNRIGTEKFSGSEINFYGSSFIADCTGEIVEEASKDTECVLTHEFDLDVVEKKRLYWGLFRDRRPETYRTVLTIDGENAAT